MHPVNHHFIWLVLGIVKRDRSMTLGILLNKCVMLGRCIGEAHAVSLKSYFYVSHESQVQKITMTPQPIAKGGVSCLHRKSHSTLNCLSPGFHSSTYYCHNAFASSFNCTRPLSLTFNLSFPCMLLSTLVEYLT
jgi:hypothetical protein